MTYNVFSGTLDPTESQSHVDFALVSADRRHAVLGHIIRPAHTMLQCVINVTDGSHLAAGWKRPPGWPR